MVEHLVVVGPVLAFGLMVGFYLRYLVGKGSAAELTLVGNWWEERNTLSCAQLQLL